MTRFRHYLNALLLIFIALFICNVAYAALYYIDGTKITVNGIPAGLTAKERLKLKTVDKQAVSEALCVPQCDQLNKAAAKAKIKAIILAENPVTPPPVCPQYTTGTPPNCAPIPCGQGFTGNQPNCTPVVVPPVTSLMPFVDKTKYVTPAVGYNDLRVRPTSEQPTNKDGSFRISCLVSHMNNDDPLLYPNQEGRAHPHTFYGNVNVKHDTNLDTLSTVGNSTCDGGIMNRSAYWHPTMVAPGGIPVLADGGAIFYYKHGALPATSIKSPPKGLRMIAGNMHAKTAAEAKSTIFWCINIALQHSNGMGKLRNIPACGTDTFLQMITTFPQCWDGKNLDSPNHQDHMAYPVENKCPTTHPVPIPEISLNLNYKVPSGGTGKWRLSSDNYEWNGSNAGYSGHADWVNGWDQPFLDGIVKNCINAVKDCHAHLLGDGRMFYRN